jgi:hypothetical protein
MRLCHESLAAEETQPLANQLPRPHRLALLEPESMPIL